MKKFDAIIIGSGQAGTPLAFKIASEGKKVAFIEKEHFGGTCVNDGCTPTKAYVARSQFRQQLSGLPERSSHSLSSVFSWLSLTA